MTGEALFISYARKDMGHVNWLERLQLYLGQSRTAGGIDFWDDSRIGVGTLWQDEIDRALSGAPAAILLIGPAFLGSTFIQGVELPRILDRHKRNGVGLFPLIVGRCIYTASCLAPYQPVNSPEQPLESLSIPEQNEWLNKVAIGVSDYVRNRGRQDQTSAASTSREPLWELVQALRMTRTAFRAQVKRRDDLVAQMEHRLGVEAPIQYERFFVRVFQEMDSDEAFVFEQIRAMTEGPLREGNAKALAVLDGNPQLLEQYPRLVELQQHLVFWLNKYDRVFSRRRDMCVLYAGVEDGVGYPRGLHAEMEAALSAAQNQVT